MNKIVALASAMDAITIVGLHGLAFYYLATGEMQLFLLACIAHSAWSIDFASALERKLLKGGKE